MKNEMKTIVVNVEDGGNYDVYIGRGGLWGNPFRSKDRNGNIEMYEKWVRGIGFLSFEQKRRAELIRRLHELRGKVLGCHCKPKTCHGDILVKLISELFD